MNGATEATVEAAALDWLREIGWPTAYGPDIAPDTPGAERANYTESFLPHGLRDALERLNPELPATTLEDAYRKLTQHERATLEVRNRAFHRLLVDGVGVEYRTADGDIHGAQVQVVDYDNPANNDWLAVNQFTVVANKQKRRADIVLFVNGLPLVVIELKSATNEDATIWTAWQQLQTYKTELSDLFAMNAALIVSDGLTARIGTLTAGREWFKPWRTIEGEELADANLLELQVLLQGVGERRRFLALLRGFIVFEDDGSGQLAKKMAGYRQFHAVRQGVVETRRAKARDVGQVAETPGRYETGRRRGGEPGDRRIGVVWHTQGAGKSLTMAFYAGAIVCEPAMENPTIVVLTDRNDLDKGAMKVVMTGAASDPPDWQPHIRNKARREALASRFRNPDDGFQVAIVRDMWLTGFDAPSLHTMYVDKPMRGHALMQAIARVNRVFKDKPGGLVVDYLGLANELKQALATYTESGGTGQTALDQNEAVALLQEKHEICRALFHGFDWRKWADGKAAERLALLPAAQEHILAQEDGKDRCVRTVRELSQAFALAVPRDEALAIRDDLTFFQAVRTALAKRSASEARTDEELDHAVRQIIDRAVAPEGVTDIFRAAGLPKPDISILSDEFLAEVRGMEHRNLAVELLHKLLKGEIANRRRENVVQARSFAEMLENTLRRYQNRAVEAAQVIEELIELARDMRSADERGEALGLGTDELAFYDALETSDSAVQVMGDEKLRLIALELVTTVRNNITIDWAQRENVRAKLRAAVKRVLNKHGYPPDKREKAAETVLEQAELLSAGWAEEPTR